MNRHTLIPKIVVLQIVIIIKLIHHQNNKDNGILSLNYYHVDASFTTSNYGSTFSSSFCIQNSIKCPENRISTKTYPTKIQLSTAEIVPENTNDDENKEFDETLEWMTDSEKSKRIRESKWKVANTDDNPSPNYFHDNDTNNEEDDVIIDNTRLQNHKRQFYTDEEEELIQSLGGTSIENPSAMRESGFLGDCTLQEIAIDYQVPICYLADVLVGWGVQPPIDTLSTLLGDMVTGEQAFAILEAIHTLDVGELNERYSNMDLITLCQEYDIDLMKGFSYAVTQKWNLPFGVRTFLRIEQEEELLKALAASSDIFGMHD
eukprot:CAMPEP_0184865330 /NCGR_PEP_ID=MMETSP0580-20130426/17723_1 /TAXON_ID=1118495 /ORGANISM="Dactyliosolen fragilissimus" /LENGTH=317 /DNA_ID=CAMNT_0027364485 /DNA_START=166 /DNA_END=1119 /DNA_ORIENTATION=-